MPKKILVVEDSDDWCLMLRTVLGARGYEVTIARSPDEGWKLATTLNHDLIIIDIIMPDASLGGLEFARKLASNTSLRPIHRLFLTVVGMDVIHEEASSLSEGVFTKPLELRNLVEKVDELLASTQRTIA